jgi:hypothetical protein
MIRNESFQGGVLVEAEVIDLDAGTVTFEVDGKVTATRTLTPDEVAAFTPPPASPDERLAALEAQNAELLAALAKVTTVAQIRAAATDLA